MFFSKFFSPLLENFQAKSLSFPPSLMIGQHTQKKKKNAMQDLIKKR
jgi:hypothetical protein